jgi:hypothetical protein
MNKNGCVCRIKWIEWKKAVTGGVLISNFASPGERAEVDVPASNVPDLPGTAKMGLTGQARFFQSFPFASRGK